MDSLKEIRRVLQESSDPDNPTAERLAALLSDVQHVAVVGLSRHLEKPARRIPSYLAAKGLDVIPVNPHAKRLLGRESYPSLGEVPEPVDLVLVFRPSEAAGEFVDAAMSRPDEPAIWLNRDIMDEFRPQLEPYYYDPSRYDTYLEQLGIEYPTVRDE